MFGLYTKFFIIVMGKCSCRYLTNKALCKKIINYTIADISTFFKMNFR